MTCGRQVFYFSTPRLKSRTFGPKRSVYGTACDLETLAFPISIVEAPMSLRLPYGLTGLVTHFSELYFEGQDVKSLCTAPGLARGFMLWK